MIEIELGGYRLCRIPDNWVVEQKRVVRSGKNKGKLQWDTVGYYATVDGAALRLLSEQIANSDATELRELIEATRVAQAAVCDAIACAKRGE